MSCGFDESLLHAYVDEELSGDDKTKVLGHIVWCESCRKEVENIKKLSKQIKETFAKQAPISALEGIQRGIEGVGTKRGMWAFKYHIVAAAAALVIVSVVSLEIFRASEQNDLSEIARIRTPALREEEETAEKPKTAAEEAPKKTGKTEQIETAFDSFLAPPTAEEKGPAESAAAVEAQARPAPAAEPAPARSAPAVRKAGAEVEDLAKAMTPPAPPAGAIKTQAGAPLAQAPAAASLTKEVEANVPRAPKTEAKDERLLSGAGGGEKKTGALSAPRKEEKRATTDFGRGTQPGKESTKVATQPAKPGVKAPVGDMVREAEAALKGKDAGALAEAGAAKPVAAQAVAPQAPSGQQTLAVAADKQAGVQETPAANAVAAEKAKTEPDKEKAGAAMRSFSMEGLVTEWSPIIRLSASGQRSARVMTLRQAQVLGAIVVSVGDPVHREGMDITTRRTLSWNEQMVKIFVLEAKLAQDAPVHIMQRTEGWVKAEEGVIPISEEVPYMVMPNKPITETGRYATITVVTQDRR